MNANIINLQELTHKYISQENVEEVIVPLIHVLKEYYINDIYTLMIEYLDPLFESKICNRKKCEVLINDTLEGDCEYGCLAHLLDYFKNKMSHYDYTRFKIVFKELLDSIEPVSNKSFSIVTGRKNKEFLQLNRNNRTVELVTETRNKDDVYNFEPILNCYPMKVISHSSPLFDEIGRVFTIEWNSADTNKPFTTTKRNIDDTIAYLKKAGWVLKSYALSDNLSFMLKCLSRLNLIDVRDKIEQHGFYLDDENRLYKVGLPFIKDTIPDEDSPEYEEYLTELKGAAEVLEDLKIHTSIDNTVLASSLKWGLVAPFNYAKKTYGDGFIPWLFLYGVGTTGKTTLGRIILYLYGRPLKAARSTTNPDIIINEVGGVNVGSVAQLGAKLGEFTTPLLVNEPSALFDNKQDKKLVDMVKSSVESINARGKIVEGRYTYYPNLTALILTSNDDLPASDAVIRRFYKLVFTQSAKISAKGSEAFESAFKFNNKEACTLNKLHALGSFCYHEIKEDLSLLSLDWKELADTLLGRFYADVGVDTYEVSWLFKWYDDISLDAFEEDLIDEIRSFLLNDINRATVKIKNYRMNGYPEPEVELDFVDDDILDDHDFVNRVFNVLNNQLIPYLGVRQVKRGVLSGEKRVYIMNNFITLLKQRGLAVVGLKDLVEKIGDETFKYKGLKLNNRSVFVADVSLVDFCKWLKPNISEEE